MTDSLIGKGHSTVELSKRSLSVWAAVALMAVTVLGFYAAAEFPIQPAAPSPSVEPAQPELLSDPAPLDDSLPSDGTGVPDAETVFAGREIPIKEPAPTF